MGVDVTLQGKLVRVTGSEVAMVVRRKQALSSCLHQLPGLVTASK